MHSLHFGDSPSSTLWVVNVLLVELHCSSFLVSVEVLLDLKFRLLFKVCELSELVQLVVKSERTSTLSFLEVVQVLRVVSTR